MTLGDCSIRACLSEFDDVLVQEAGQNEICEHTVS